MSSDLNVKILLCHKTAAKLIPAFLLPLLLSANTPPLSVFCPTTASRGDSENQRAKHLPAGLGTAAIVLRRWAGQGGNDASLRSEVVWACRAPDT